MRLGGLWLASIAIAATLFGCSPAPDVTLTLTLDSADPTQVAATRNVLEKRFKAFRPNFFATTSSAIDGARLVFVFRRGAPDRAVLERLYRTRGELRVGLRDSVEPAWLTDADIDTVNLVHRDSERVIQVRLSDEAGRRMLDLTTQNLGQFLRMTLDDRVLNDARVNGVFTNRFEITGTDLGDDGAAQELIVVMRHGALRARVVDASFEPATAAAQ